MNFGLSKDVRHGTVILTLSVSGVPGEVMTPEFEDALLNTTRAELVSAVDQQIDHAATVLARLDPSLFDDVAALAAQKHADREAAIALSAEPEAETPGVTDIQKEKEKP